MIELIPVVEPAQMVAVLFFQLLAIYKKIVAKTITAYRTGIEI